MFNKKFNKKAKSKIFHYSFFPKNHRGDKIISIYWFAVLFIVAAAVVYMAVLFYGEPYDVREIEANVLINQVADCFSEGGYLKQDRLNKSFNLLTECKLNFNTEEVYDWKEQGQYYIEVKIYDFVDREDPFGDLKSNVFAGNLNWKTECDKGKNFPVCTNRSFYTLGDGDRPYIVNVLGVVRKTEKNVQ